MQAGYYPIIGTPQRGAAGFESNHAYLSPSQQQVARPALFHRRNERLDWRRIAAVDVDRIAREMDFQALQDNLEQITFCNIEGEVDSRAMDPNYVKIYKLAQLTIEYLLVCQEQITTQLADYDQLKSRAFHEQQKKDQKITELEHKNEEGRKELKKRRKMIETQQRMLVVQNSNYHLCPECSHAFLTAAYLQAHMKRRHSDYVPTQKAHSDVDADKEIQRLKDELHKKDTELQVVRVQKAADHERIQDRETQIRQLKDDIQTLTNKITILDDRYSHATANVHSRSSSPRQHGADLSELLQENRRLHAEIEELKKKLQQSEKANEKHLREISALKENLRVVQGASGDTSHLSEELLASQRRHNEEKARRKKLEDDLQQANAQLAQLQHLPAPLVDQKASTVARPVVPSSEEPSIPETVQLRPARPVQTTETLLPEYCPRVVRRLNENPRFLTKFRESAKEQLREECEELGFLDIDTRMTDLDHRTKMEQVLTTRRNIQNDLPNFERIRDDLSRTLDRLAHDRLNVRNSGTSIRSAGSKLVTFEDDKQRRKEPAHVPTVYDNPSKGISDARRTRPSTVPDQSIPIYDQSRPIVANPAFRPFREGEENDDSGSSVTESELQPIRPVVATEIRPPPRRTVPASGVSALISNSMRPAPSNGTSAVTALVRPPAAKPPPMNNNFASDSENESQASDGMSNGAYGINVGQKTRIIQQKLDESNMKGQKPTIGAIAQGFRPTHESLANTNDDRDDNSVSLTTLNTANPLPKARTDEALPQLVTRQLVSRNPLSSGEASQYTYDSLMKSNGAPGVKATDFRRPATADSAKTSNMGSDDDLSDESP